MRINLDPDSIVVPMSRVRAAVSSGIVSAEAARLICCPTWFQGDGWLAEPEPAKTEALRAPQSPADSGDLAAPGESVTLAEEDVP